MLSAVQQIVKHMYWHFQRSIEPLVVLVLPIDLLLEVHRLGRYMARYLYLPLLLFASLIASNLLMYKDSSRIRRGGHRAGSKKVIRDI
jgi:hypothetical protein